MTVPTIDLVSEEPQRGATDTAYEALLARLSRLSVDKHLDPLVEIPWDDLGFRIDPTDPRFGLGPDDALSATDWYRSQPPETKARLGLHRVCSNMKVGLAPKGHPARHRARTDEPPHQVAVAAQRRPRGRGPKHGRPSQPQRNQLNSSETRSAATLHAAAATTPRRVLRPSISKHVERSR